MLQLKTGIRSELLKLPFRKAVRWASEMGFEGIAINARHELKPAELSKTAIREIRKLLADHRLSVASVQFPTRRGYADGNDIERRVDATKEAMQFAFALGCSHVANCVGTPQDVQTNQLFRETMADLARWGQHVGARLAVRTGRETSEQLEQLFQFLPPASIGIDFDPGEILLHDASPVDWLSRLGAHVLHFHARDAVRDLSASQTLPAQLGRGSNDWPNLLAILERNQYSGFITLEPQSPNILQECQESLAFLHHLFQ